MKLVKIEHDRCDEYAATTYVWAEDNLTEEALESLIESAQKSYLQAEEDFKGSAPLNYKSYPDYKQYPDKTVKEIDAIFAEETLAYKAWTAKRDAARQSFDKHLIAVGNGAISGFYDVPPSMEVTAYWGHRHGTILNFGALTLNPKI